MVNVKVVSSAYPKMLQSELSSCLYQLQNNGCKIIDIKLSVGTKAGQQYSEYDKESEKVAMIIYDDCENLPEKPQDGVKINIT